MYTGSRRQDPNTTFTPGCTLSNSEPPAYDPAHECADTDGFPAAVAAAKNADQVVLAARRDARDERRGRVAVDARPARAPAGADRRDQGDRQAVRGRAVQRPAADARAASTSSPRSSRPGSPASRPATRSPTPCSARPTRAASCRCRFPRSVGQVPIYYNHEPTGRPCDATSKYNSRYRDMRLVRLRCSRSGTGSATRRSRCTTSRSSSHTDVAAAARVPISVEVTNTGNAPVTTSCSSTSTIRSRASSSRSGVCAASSGSRSSRVRRRR